MNLLIDTISRNANIILFDKNIKIIDRVVWCVKWNESSTLIPKIDELIKKNSITYNDLENMIVVNGPGSFTWVRTTVLVVNTINFIIGKNLIPLSYFDLFDTYPIIKVSSKRDCFVKWSKDSKIEILDNEDVKIRIKNEKIRTIFWDILEEKFPWLKILDKVDYESIIKGMDFCSKNTNKVEPLYVKKPNIS
jgi:tRNA A37 threonylcarbamoyladenosine modification protein TsaB